METMRLQVFLSHAGVASRRAAETLITAGRVTVNGALVTELGAKVCETDTVTVDGIPVTLEKRMRYIALNKPARFICASHDPQGRPLALSLIPASGERLYNIGRLDYQTEGILLFTNDGAFAAKCGHPRSSIEKEYVVEISRNIGRELEAQLSTGFLRGIEIDGTTFKAASVRKVQSNAFSITLIEGKNREIRRVFSHFHLHITKLTRVRYGNITLDGLPTGKTRDLTQKEIDALAKN